MKRIGHIATYPARLDTLPDMLASVVDQLDQIYVVVNEFGRQEIEKLPKYDHVKYIRPIVDLKDTGKFYPRGRTADEFVFLMDDDIKFPADYAETMINFLEELPTRDAIVGLHGVTYSDLFDGVATSRFVSKFDKQLNESLLVNQLGTGCMVMLGDQIPPFEIMRDSQRFVDVRFARYCFENDIVQVCMRRPLGWLTDMGPEESIFETYTRDNHDNHKSEIGIFGGYGKINPKLALAVERM